MGNYVVPELQLYGSAAASDPDAPSGRGKAPGVVVAWWEGELDRDMLNAGLRKQIDPSDVETAVTTG